MKPPQGLMWAIAIVGAAALFASPWAGIEYLGVSMGVLGVGRIFMALSSTGMVRVQHVLYAVGSLLAALLILIATVR
jgi:hypothetical protein